MAVQVREAEWALKMAGARCGGGPCLKELGMKLLARVGECTISFYGKPRSCIEV